MSTAFSVSRLRTICSLLASIWLLGCAHEPHSTSPANQAGTTTSIAATPSPNTRATSLSIQGQMSIKLAAWEEQAAKGLSLGFFFTGNAEQGQLELISLMGSQLAQIGWQPDGAWLINQDGRHDFTDLDVLTQQALGEALPLRTLIYWMQGQPDPTLPSQPGSAPGLFEQSGWRIDAHEQSPKRIQAQRAGNKQQRAIQIKVYLDL